MAKERARPRYELNINDDGGVVSCRFKENKIDLGRWKTDEVHEAALGAMEAMIARMVIELNTLSDEKEKACEAMEEMIAEARAAGRATPPTYE